MIPQPSHVYGGPIPGRHRAPLPRIVIARRVALLLLAVTAGIVLGVIGGTRDASSTPGVPPPLTTPGYEDERWQDPSGLPYCLADGSPQDLLPCIDAQTGVVTEREPDSWQATTQVSLRKQLRPHGHWVPLTDDIADALAEGVDDPSTIPDSGDGCLMRVDRRWNVTVRCPDGRTIRS